MWIARTIEDTIKELEKQFPVLLISGARQVGKTSLLVHLYPEVAYISLDDPAKAAQAESSPREFIESLPVPIIIDEVQYAPSLFRFLKIAADRSKGMGHFFLTGSQLFSLMQNVSESLAGRAGILTLPTLSMDEVHHSVNGIEFRRYVITGGYPALYQSSDIRPEHWFPSYISTYLERDVRNVMNVGNLRDYYRFIRALALRTGQVLSLSDIARDVGVAPNTVKSWLSVLETSGLVFLLEPYFRNPGKRLVKSPKIYFTDTGLACYLMGIETWDNLRKSPFIGAVWETYVFGQLYRYFLNRGIPRPRIWYWRTTSGSEIDFLIEKDGKLIAVEAKSAEYPSSSALSGFQKLKRVYGAESILRQIVVAPTDSPFPLDDGTLVHNAIGLDSVL